MEIYGNRKWHEENKTEAGKRGRKKNKITPANEQNKSRKTKRGTHKPSTIWGKLRGENQGEKRQQQNQKSNQKQETKMKTETRRRNAEMRKYQHWKKHTRIEKKRTCLRGINWHSAYKQCDGYWAY